MQRLEDLLDRIRWDRAFADGVFSIGYIDRVAGGEVVIPFTDLSLDPSRPGMFSIRDDAGMTRRIPLHRIRTIYKDSVVIWRRPAPSRS